MLCVEAISDAMLCGEHQYLTEEDLELLLTLSLLMLLACDVAFLLNILVTFARSLSEESLRFEPPLPLSPVSCLGIFGRSDGDICSGSFVSGLARMVGAPESPPVFGRGRSDVFDGF